MNRRDFLSASALAAGTAALMPMIANAASAATSARRRPNVVIVIADDTTPSYHGCYGGPTPTPNIDALAAEGLRFERGYCTSALCSPSRYAIFTGHYTQRSPASLVGPATDPALVSQTGDLETSSVTLARILGTAGYSTGHFGKWHSRFNLAEFGMPPMRLPQGDVDDPEVDATLRRNHAKASEVIRRCAGFEVADRIFWGNIDAKQGLDPRIDAHNPAWITDGALNFIEACLATPDRPFYVHIANTVPHTPDCHLTLGKDHRYTWGGKLAESPRSHPDDATVFDRLRAANLPTEGPFAGVNAGQIMIDDQIGAIVAKLRAAGQLENTLFIYTADHGLPGKGSCHHIGQHLPFILHWPEGGFQPGRTVAEPFSWIHITPTLAEACAAPLPAGYTPDGVSVLAAMRHTAPWPPAAQVAYHEMGWSRSVIKGRYHYIATRYPGSVIEELKSGKHTQAGVGLDTFDRLNATFFPDYFEPDQLYDLVIDPMELRNIVEDPTRAAVLADMRRELHKICAALPRPFPAEPHPFQRTEAYHAVAKARRDELARIRHYPANTDHVATVVHANYDDPDLAP